MATIATAATISRVALPSFRSRGYNERFVLGSLAAGSTLGVLIPPSILLSCYNLMFSSQETGLPLYTPFIGWRNDTQVNVCGTDARDVGHTL